MIKYLFNSILLLSVVASARMLPAGGDSIITETRKWRTILGGQADDICGGAIITADSCYAIVGGTKSKGNGEFDVYIAKVSRSGKILWEKNHGGSGNDIGASIRQTNDGGFIIAGRSETRSLGKFDAFLMKTDGDGNIKWKRNYGGAEDDFGAMAIPSYEGGYYLVGTTASKGFGMSDVYLVRTDSLGKMVWEKTYGGVSQDFGTAIYQSKELNLMILGNSQSKSAGGTDMYVVRADNYGRPLWDRTYGSKGEDFGVSLLQAADGNYLILGAKGLYADPDSGDVYLVKIDRTGRPLWEKTFENLNRDAGAAAVISPEGNIVILADDDIGEKETSANPMILFADGRGNYQNDVVLLDIENQKAASILCEPDGFVVAGTFIDGESFSIYIKKTGKNGEAD